MRSRIFFVALAAVSIGVGSAVALSNGASASRQATGQSSRVAVNGPTCSQVADSGGGQSALHLCVSDEGNLLQWSYAGGIDMIQPGTVIEGYALCSTGNATDFDGGNTQGGWGAATVTGTLAGNNFKSVRTSTDGKFTLTQTITPDKPNQGAVIKMTVKNNTAVKQSGVLLTRYVDIDAGGSTSNDGARIALQTTIWRETSQGANLRRGSITTPAAFVLQTFGELSAQESTCTGSTGLANQANTTGTDLGMRLTYTLGNLAAGASKTEVFKYSAA